MCRPAQTAPSCAKEIEQGCHDIATSDALSHVYGYATGIDMTRRDLQNTAKETRRPWEASKAFEGSAPFSAIARADDIGHPDQGAIWLDVDGERRQIGGLNQLIWKVPEVIATLSQMFALAPGDLIFTGTPSGVGPVTRGQTMRGGIGEVSATVV